MKVSTQRFVDKWVGVPLCWLLSVAYGLKHGLLGRPSNASVQKILVVMLSEMGSLVLAYPMFQALRQRYPDAKIHTLMFARNREVIDLLGLDIEVITVRDTGLLALLLDSFTAILRLRRSNFDVSLDCELFSRVSAIFCGLSGAAERVGFHRHTQEGLYRGDFFTRPVLYNPHQHIADQFLTLAHAIGSNSWPPAKLGHAPASSYPRPSLRVEPSELAAAKAKLRELVPSAAKRELALLYVSGGALPIRAWPIAHFEQVARAWVAQGYAVGIVGLPCDVAQAMALVAAVNSEHCCNIAGQTSNVRELVLMFHHAKVLLANDGGPGHFAVLADLPTVMLFGPETPRLYGSLGQKVVHLHHARMPCSPCLTAFNHRLSPCDGDNQCLKQISPQAALDAAHQLVGA